MITGLIKQLPFKLIQQGIIKSMKHAEAAIVEKIQNDQYKTLCEAQFEITNQQIRTNKQIACTLNLIVIIQVLILALQLVKMYY